MCGIAGIVGRPGAARLVRQALLALEYRGYDSCGVAWLNGGIQVQRAVGSVEGLHVAEGREDVALGHTRWATHGGVTEANAHPHLDCKDAVAIVHNGVLLNHVQMRADLTRKGHKFSSQTDSEALAHLWEDAKGTGLERLTAIRSNLQGTYSIAVLDKSEKALYVTKQRNPLWVTHVDGVAYLASDPVALRKHATAATPLEDGDVGRLAADGITLYDAKGRRIERRPLDIRGADDRTEKAGYEHFMLKEVHETPACLNRLLIEHLRQEPPYVELGAAKGLLEKYGRAIFLGAGTSHHAGLLASSFLQTLAGIPADAKATPEFKDDRYVPEKGTLLVAMSQSGETLDTLQALHRLRSQPAPTLAFTNHPSSSLGRQADHTVALQSGVEVSVAATKTFLSQSMLAYLLALDKARREKMLGDAALAHRARNLAILPRAIERTLLRKQEIAGMARALVEVDSLFILAKGNLVPIAMEAALKLKEIAYQHAEAYPAGELKHGPFALLTPETAVLFLHGPGSHQDAVLNSIQEVMARGSQVVVLAMDGCKKDGLPLDRTVWLPAVEEDLAPFVFAVASHLLSYWVAKARALPIDRPRNLAKSVTVE